jgi:aspartyl-tRNA(Asn)/glutamyl-tRNA(Gln) amidotransferase subunit A
MEKTRMTSDVAQTHMPGHRFLSIAEVSKLVHQRKISPIELVTQCLERIEQLNPKINAFITVTANQALKDAEAAERDLKKRNWKGPLHGIPIGIKDMFDTAGIRTTAAFVHFRDRVPAKDAEVVTKLKEAGAILVGKMNMHELAAGTTSVVSYFGEVRNPWNPTYVAGGSSGGSAAAVAAGLCFATVDTDAIGSCRLPAAICGVTGFKATYGLVSPKGILEGEEAEKAILLLGHPAVTSCTVEDTAILLNVLANSKATPSKSQTDYRLTLGLETKPRIGIVNNFKATDEVRMAFIQAVETFRSLGHDLHDEIFIEFPSFDLSHIEEDRERISQYLFKNIDVLILPTTTDVTPTIENARVGGPQAVSTENTFFCNYYGLPVISVPCGFSKSGLPLGFQIVGPRWGESQVLDVAHKFQQATQWHLQHPGTY